MKDVNTYIVKFFAFCPITPARIEYTLTMHRDPNPFANFKVEDLIDAVTLLQRGTHEEFADQLHREFGGRQVLVADHHGVRIETMRGF